MVCPVPVGSPWPVAITAVHLPTAVSITISITAIAVAFFPAAPVSYAISIAFSFAFPFALPVTAIVTVGVAIALTVTAGLHRQHLGTVRRRESERSVDWSLLQ